MDLNDALSNAAEQGNDTKIKRLLRSGADVNAKGYDDRTPLHYAALNGKDSSIRTLVDAKADVNAKDIKGRTPLHMAALMGNDSSIRTLVDAGADGNAKNDDGDTPLHRAAQLGKDSSIRTLVDAGAAVNAKNNDGNTPLHMAAERGNDSSIRILVDAGADLHAKDNHGRRPLHLAAYSGKDSSIRTLVDTGADGHAKDNYGYTPLHYAAYMGNDSHIRTLVDAGADVHAKNNDGNTPLHRAAYMGKDSSIRTLVDVGADVHAKDNDDYTPLHYAAQEGYDSSIRTLVDAGADVHAKNNDGNTPFAEAERKNKPKAAAVLKKLMQQADRKAAEQQTAARGKAAAEKKAAEQRVAKQTKAAAEWWKAAERRQTKAAAEWWKAAERTAAAEQRAEELRKRVQAAEAAFRITMQFFKEREETLATVRRETEERIQADKAKAEEAAQRAAELDQGGEAGGRAAAKPEEEEDHPPTIEVPVEVLHKLFEQAKQLESSGEATVDPPPAGQAAISTEEYTELITNVRELHKLNRAMEGASADERLLGRALKEMVTKQGQSEASRAQWTAIQSSAPLREYATFFLFHLESLLRAYEVLASRIIAKGDRSTTSAVLDELAQGGVAAALSKVKFTKVVAGFVSFVKKQLSGLPGADLAGTVLEKLVTFKDAREAQLSVARVNLFLRRMDMLRRTTATTCGALPEELARQMSWCRNHGLGGGLTDEKGRTELSQCQALLKKVLAEPENTPAKAFGKADALKVVKLLLCGDAMVDQLLDRSLGDGGQAVAGVGFEDVVKSLAARVFETSVRDLPEASSHRLSVPVAVVPVAAPVAASGGGAMEGPARPEEMMELVRGLGVKLKPGELEMLVDALEQLGFDDIESLSFPSAPEDVTRASLKSKLEACGMGDRCGGVSGKVHSKLAEHFGWQDVDPLKRKSVASKEELAQLRQQVEQQAKDKKRLEEQLQVVAQQEEVARLRRQLEQQAKDKERMKEQLEQQAKQVGQQAEQLHQHAKKNTRLQRELSDVKKNMVKRKPGDVEVTGGGRGGGGGSLAQVQSQSHSHSQSGENAEGQSDEVGATEELKLAVYEQGEQIHTLTKQVAELQDDRSGSSNRKPGQAEEDAAGVATTLRDKGIARVDKEGKGGAAERQARNKKQAKSKGLFSGLFGRESR